MRPPIQDKFFLESMLSCHSKGTEESRIIFWIALAETNRRRFAKPVLSKVEGLKITAPLREAWLRDWADRGPSPSLCYTTGE